MNSKHSLVFSAIQPTAMPHLGNYLGAIKPWTRLVNRGIQVVVRRAFESVNNVVNETETENYDGKEFMFAIADMHAWTSSHNDFRNNNRNEEDPSFQTAAMLMACGLDPLPTSSDPSAAPRRNLILFQQSQVPYHANLMWLLSCMVPLGGLEAMTHWREKVKKSTQVEGEKGSLGLLSYPVLQAADILLYRATHVPVGEDQKQHLELCRNLARRLNHRIKVNGDGVGGIERGVFHNGSDSPDSHNCYFPVPDPMIAGLGGRIKCLRKVQEKMSKSTVNPEGTIFLSDTPADVERKIGRAVTDSLPGITFDRESRPALANLLVIYASVLDNDSVSESDIPDLIESHGLGAMSKQQFKAMLIDLLVPRLSQIQEKYQMLLGRDRSRVEQVLVHGATTSSLSSSATSSSSSDLASFVSCFSGATGSWTGLSSAFGTGIGASSGSALPSVPGSEIGAIPIGFGSCGDSFFKGSATPPPLLSLVSSPFPLRVAKMTPTGIQIAASSKNTPIE